ncbi:hypothetical protein E2C01_041314 [Portunus trituberculatus]|uniref:Uncharacterized protein n=1 Tax=Portunus trituberculatus TaxID=210409 RepID=A0A5B7FT87_PORTR|nr:hypothetical protein [Portunus trituberculatus]
MLPPGALQRKQACRVRRSGNGGEKGGTAAVPLTPQTSLLPADAQLAARHRANTAPGGAICLRSPNVALCGLQVWAGRTLASSGQLMHVQATTGNNDARTSAKTDPRVPFSHPSLPHPSLLTPFPVTSLEPPLRDPRELGRASLLYQGRDAPCFPSWRAISSPVTALEGQGHHALCTVLAMVIVVMNRDGKGFVTEMGWSLRS